MRKNIAIIGGGIAGLVMGIALKQKGYQVKIFEQTKQFQPLGGDIALWPNGLRYLDELGLYQDIYHASGKYSSIKIGSENGVLLAETPVQNFLQIAPYQPLNICRYRLHEIFLNHFGKENIFLDKRCISISETLEYCEVTFQDGVKVEADLVIGADGVHSVTREYVIPDWQEEYAGYMSFGGINSAPYSIQFNLIFGKFFSGAFPVDNNRQIFFFVTASPDEDISRLSLKDKFKFFLNHTPLLDEMLYKLQTSLGSAQNENYFFTKNYYLYPLASWSKGRMVLIGDAIHRVGPILGCVTSIILEGISKLVECLSQYKNNYQDAYDAYRVLHQPRVLQLLTFERKVAKALSQGKLKDYKNFNDEFIHFLAAASLSK